MLGTSSTYLTLPCHFCCCKSFLYDTLDCKHMFCKHQLACLVAAALRVERRRDVSDDEMAALLATMAEESAFE